MNDSRDNDDRPLDELAAFVIEPDPDIPGRVQRGINRTLLAGDALELSYSGLLATYWNYLIVILESARFGKPDQKER